jgi:hypothetical protein
MHNNPVKRGLVKEPGDWPWSSLRFYFLQGGKGRQEGVKKSASPSF